MVRAPLPMAKSRPRGDYPGFGSPGHCFDKVGEGLSTTSHQLAASCLGRQRDDMGNSG